VIIPHIVLLTAFNVCVLAGRKNSEVARRYLNAERALPRQPPLGFFSTAPPCQTGGGSSIPSDLLPPTLPSLRSLMSPPLMLPSGLPWPPPAAEDSASSWRAPPLQPPRCFFSTAPPCQTGSGSYIPSNLLPPTLLGLPPQMPPPLMFPRLFPPALLNALRPAPLGLNPSALQGMLPPVDPSRIVNKVRKMSGYHNIMQVCVCLYCSHKPKMLFP
jgi:hypothetical protein